MPANERRRRRSAVLKAAIAAMLAAALAGCVVVPVGPARPYRPCCYYHPYRW